MPLTLFLYIQYVILKQVDSVKMYAFNAKLSFVLTRRRRAFGAPLLGRCIREAEHPRFAPTVCYRPFHASAALLLCCLLPAASPALLPLLLCCICFPAFAASLKYPSLRPMRGRDSTAAHCVTADVTGTGSSSRERVKSKARQKHPSKFPVDFKIKLFTAAHNNRSMQTY